MGLNYNVWLPHLKFTLQTIAITYPSHPNDVSKRKYYDLIQNIPVFFPLDPIGKNFLNLLDKYPVTPYLSSRMSFMKWIHFIFNKIHEQLEQPIDEFYDSLEKYYDEYKCVSYLSTVLLGDDFTALPRDIITNLALYWITLFFWHSLAFLFRNLFALWSLYLIQCT